MPGRHAIAIASCVEGHAKPAAQLVQLDAAPVAYVPPRHAFIVAALVEGQEKPGGQGVHDVALPSEYVPSEQTEGLRRECASELLQSLEPPSSYTHSHSRLLHSLPLTRK